jgi:L-fuculose-phosphate aldolase
VLPEVEVFLGEIPFAPYETPGGQKFADTVLPFLKPGTNCIILTNHGTVSFGKDLEDAYWKTEIVDAYCRILILARQLGGINYLNEQKSRELLDLKKRLGFDDPRFHVENCDLCGNTAFRDGYREPPREPRVFDVPPAYAGYLQPAAGPAEVETLVQSITDQVLEALASR